MNLIKTLKSQKKNLNNEIKGTFAVFDKCWRVCRRYPLSFVFFTFSPLLWLLPHLLYGTAVTGGRYSLKLEALIGFGDVLIFTGLGLLFMAFFDRTLWGTSYSIREEEFLGTLESLYITPVSRFSIIFGNSLFYISQVAVGCTIQMILISVWYKDSFNFVNMLLATLFVLLAVIMVQSLSLIFTAFVFWQKEGWRFILIVHSIIYLITPFVFPIVVLPNFLQAIASVNPLTFAIEGFRNAFLYGFSFEILRYLFVMIIAIPIMILIGSIIFQFAERFLRKKALLGQY